MTKSDQTIVLIGFMGAGKTTIGRELAQALDREFVDLDLFIESLQTRTISDIIYAYGEEKFRELEAESLREVLRSETPMVIASGGGTWTFAVNRAAIAVRHAVSVWLDTPFEVCWERIAASPFLRPLAPDESSAHALFDERRADYALADVCIAANANASTSELVNMINSAIDHSSASER